MPAPTEPERERGSWPAAVLTALAVAALAAAVIFMQDGNTTLSRAFAGVAVSIGVGTVLIPRMRRNRQR